MTNILIREVTILDLVLLQNIGIQTFTETFASENTAENMKIYLDESFSIARLTAELNDNNAAFYFVTIDENVVGYLKINFGSSQTELKDDKAIEIERIYVLSAYQRQQVGQLLYQKAIEIARTKNANYIWLGVWENNLKAISFYKKNGFEVFDRHIFKLGNDEQTDFMMKLKL